MQVGLLQVHGHWLFAEDCRNAGFGTGQRWLDVLMIARANAEYVQVFAREHLAVVCVAAVHSPLFAERLQGLRHDVGRGDERYAGRRPVAFGVNLSDVSATDDPSSVVCH